MKMRFTLIVASSLFTAACQAQTWDENAKKRLTELGPKAATSYVIVKDITENTPEQAAISAFSWDSSGIGGRSIVGGALRAYSESRNPIGVWGADIYAVGAPQADSQLVGAEIAVYQRNPANRQASVGINTIFGGRLGTDIPIQSGTYNENSVAWFVSAYTRSPVGEYAGWNKMIKVAPLSLDRTQKVPYISLIHLEKPQHTELPIYLAVYPCQATMCGLRLTPQGLELWQDVDGIPIKIKLL